MDTGQLKPIRVLIAEDSPTIRYHLTRIINDAPPLEVVGTAGDGLEALRLVDQLVPHVISMDVQMPAMDGLEVTRRIMRHQPTPVVIVSGMLEREIDLTFRALQAGALAAVPKPPAPTAANFQQQRQQLVSTLRAMSEVQVVRRWASAYQVTATPAQGREYHTQGVRFAPQLIAVAASAGGPSALATLVGGLGSHLSIPMILIQHMPAAFLPGLGRWLQRFTDRPIRTPQPDAPLQAGTIYIAPAGVHLRVAGGRAGFRAVLDATQDASPYQPSADVLFRSVAATCGDRGVGIVLTGMGDDGAAGLLAMREANARTFAQDEESAVVYGMPGAAARLGAAERILPPAQIAATIRKLI